MKKFLQRSLSAIILLLAFADTYSQNNGLLFEIRGNGLKKPSYLLGTFPLSNKYKFTIDNSILKYSDACDRVTTEIDFIKGPLELLDSQGLKDYSYRIMARLFNSYINEVYLPSFATPDEAEKALFTLLSSGGNSITQLEQMYASKLGLNSDLDQWQWPNYKVMQYAIKKGKPYSGMESIDSLVFDYIDFIKKHEDMAQVIAKSMKDIPSEQQQSIMKLIPSYIASGKADNLFSLLKHLQNGADTLLLEIINIRTKYLTSQFNKMIREQSVFAAVNWFTLTNPNGILQQLRNMGYKVKVVKMKNQEELTFNTINSIPYECKFNSVKSNDGFLEFSFPGQAHTIQAGPYITSWLYYDVINRTSYTVARIKHNYTFKGKSLEYILRKTDSLIYEKVPGTIEKKELMVNEFYTGYDITSFNRKDNYTHLKFFVTPYEFILVKCEGEKRYALQPAADKFFENFKLNTSLLKSSSNVHQLETVFFKAQAPGFVSGFYDPDFYHTFQESFDPGNNIDLIYTKGTYHSSEYLDEDTFLLNSSVSAFTEYLNLKERNRSYGVNNVTVNFKDDEARYYTVKAIRYGIYYYIIAASYPDSSGIQVKTYFDNFHPINHTVYPTFFNYSDTALHFNVTTPDIAFEEPHSRVARLIQRFSDIGKKAKAGKTASTHTYTSFNTGETIKVDLSKYDEFTYFQDSLSFWKTVLDNAGVNYEFKVSRKKSESKIGTASLSFLLTDTNTSLGIKIKVIIKGKYLYVISAGIDTTFDESPFVSAFYNSFELPNDTIFDGSVFQAQTDTYLDALISTDSATVAKALNIFPWYPFGKNHIVKLGYMLHNIPPQKDENAKLLIKDRIMDILGSIKEDAATDMLKQWYTNAGDTSEVQMRLLSSMARQKTRYAMNSIKDLLIENPPAEKSTNQMGFFFSTLEDSARLAASVVPDLLPLLSNEDFKEDFLGFLAYMADSNFIDPKIYEANVSSLILQARNELKRQSSKETEETKSTNSNQWLVYYTKVLMPFYNSNDDVRLFIEKCLQSTDLNLRQDIAYYLLKHNKQVPDSIWVSLAKNDFQRYSLIEDLAQLNHPEKLPLAYRTQESYARSFACREVIYDIGKDKYKPEDLVYLSKRKVYFHQQWGYVYLFKAMSGSNNYESAGNEQEWKLILSGMQPADTSKTSLNTNLTYASSETMNDLKSVEEQFDLVLHTVINARRHVKYLPVTNTFEGTGDDETKNYEN